MRPSVKILLATAEAMRGVSLVARPSLGCCRCMRSCCRGRWRSSYGRGGGVGRGLGVGLGLGGRVGVGVAVAVAVEVAVGVASSPAKVD
jgi:hypothetical protein